jgi:aspartyl-tRNA synthetase
LPPFTIEDETDGGEELRMKYRYLDIRRNPVKDKLIFRHKMAQKVRNYLSDKGFIEVETPVLIKSTPEGARDFVVPSRMNQGQFYASTISTNFQTTLDGWWNGQIFPNRKMFP